MSWMDSWSRPGKHQSTPAPFYLLPNGGEDIPYCRSCGRVISSRKTGPSTVICSAVTDDNINGHRKHQKKGKRKGGGAKSDDPPPDSSQTQQQPQPSEVKYCSSRCRTNKPGKTLDGQIEEAFVKFLSGEEVGLQIASEITASGLAVKKSTKKGDTRILVPCDLVEEYIFGEERRIRTGEDDRETKTFGRKKNRASRVIQPQPESEADSHTQQRHTDDHDSGIDGEFFEEQGRRSSSLDPEVLARMSVRSGTRIRPPQQISQVNGSVGGEKGLAERILETEEMKEKRIEGQRRSHEREMVRSAARRGVVFGFAVQLQDGNGDGCPSGQLEMRKKCEAVMQGKVVEPSFAKGSWGVRWREE